MNGQVYCQTSRCVSAKPTCFLSIAAANMIMMLNTITALNMITMLNAITALNMIIVLNVRTALNTIMVLDTITVLNMIAMLNTITVLNKITVLNMITDKHENCAKHENCPKHDNGTKHDNCAKHDNFAKHDNGGIISRQNMIMSQTGGEGHSPETPPLKNSEQQSELHLHTTTHHCTNSMQISRVFSAYILLQVCG